MNFCVGMQELHKIPDISEGQCVCRSPTFVAVTSSGQPSGKIVLT